MLFQAAGARVYTRATMKTPARPRSAARPYLTLCVPALAAGLAAGAHAQEAKQPGTVIEGSVDVYNWAPADKSHAVEAKDINLRRVFEDMGPVATQWYQHVLTLSNPWMEGRAPGLRGNDLAAEYVEFWLKRAGLEPAFPVEGADGVTPKEGPWKSYRQHFTLTGGAPKVETAKASVGADALEEGKDFSVLAICGNGKVEAPVVFVGYGIEKGKDGYTSFAESDDLTGKIAMVMRYEPLDDRGRSRWAERRFSEHSGMLDKIEALVKRGVVGIVMVAPPGARDGKERLEDVSSSRWGRPEPVPIVQISVPTAEKLLAAADTPRGSLMDWRKLADEGTIKTVALGDKARIALETKMSAGGTPAQNVGAVLRGKGSLADEWVVVGAHFDHVGYGYFGTSPGNTGKLHPGADDNASGTSAMLCIAQAMADIYGGKDAPADARSILFLGFTAEESGLRGSKWFVEHPTIPGDKTALMINMDMVGRLRSDDLSVGGVGSAKDFMQVLRPIFESSGLTIRADPTGRGPSDHASFYGAGIPVLFVYTGNHDEYHTPQDFGYTVNPAGAAKIVALASEIAKAVATRPAKLEFNSTDGMRSPDRGYAAVRLGVMPAMGGEEDADPKAPKGVRVDSVSADTSAADAGIKKGDILVKWDGEPLEGAGAMMGKLRAHKPGDVVKVTIWRDGKEQVVEVTLRASKPRE